MFVRHCSDEQLLAHLDGELRWLVRLRVRRHLERCWHCRTRLDGLESEVHSLLQRIDSSPMPAERIASARRRFFDRPEVAAIEFVGDQRAGGRMRWRWMPVAAALAVSISAFAWLRLTLAPSAPQPVEMPKVFRLPATVAVAPAPMPPPPPPPMVLSHPTVSPPLPVAPINPVDLDALELRARYALHRAHSCLGEGIEVVRTGVDGLAVRGVVQSAARREEIVLLLGLLAPSGAVQVQLRTSRTSKGATAKAARPDC